MINDVEAVYRELAPCMSDKTLALRILRDFGSKCFSAKKRLERVEKGEGVTMEYEVSVEYRSGRIERKRFPSLKNKKYNEFIRDCYAAQELGAVKLFSTKEVSR